MSKRILGLIAVLLFCLQVSGQPSAYLLYKGCIVTAITGTLSACAGSTSQLTDLGMGGTWSSSVTTIATVGTSGVVTGVSSGTTTITYQTGFYCKALVTFTVNALPASISGTLSVTTSTTTQLTDATAGGTWSSVTTTVATIGTSGLVTGVSTGTSTISYVLSTGCYATAVVTVTSGSFTPPTANLQGDWYAGNATTITTVSGAVSQWNDQNGSGHNMLQGTALSRPTVTGSGTSAEMIFSRFTTGAGCFMSSSFTQSQPVTVYSIVQQIAWSTNDGLWDGTTANTMLLRQRNSSPNIGMYAGGGFSTDNPNLPVGSYQLVTTVYDGTSSTITVNMSTSVSGSGIGTAAPGGMQIGASGSGGGLLASSSSFKRVMYYSASHNAALQAQMQEYLLNFFGIYNTLDPLKKGTNITVSGGNLTAGNTAYSFASIFGLGANGHSTGKYYCEFIPNNIGPSGNQAGFGFGNTSSPLNNYLGSDANGWMYWSQVGVVSNYYNNGAFLSPAPTLVYNYGDVLGMALDLTAGKAWFSVNGVWNNSGNPSTGSNPSFTFPTGVVYYPIGCFFWANGTFNFGATAYANTAPTGFKNWTIGN